MGTGAGRCGAFASRWPGNALYHQGSADLLDDEVLPGGVDPFLCGIAGR
jgi:hypothetical protein